MIGFSPRMSLMVSCGIVVCAAVIAAGVLFMGENETAHAQLGGAEEPFGGKFTTIRHVCCDGTWVLQHQAAGQGLPDGTFKTDWGMDAYRELFYYPLPQTCAVGFVRQGGSCTTVDSFCESSVSVDYTITTIGTSNTGCQLQSSGSLSGGSDVF